MRKIFLLGISCFLAAVNLMAANLGFKNLGSKNQYAHAQNLVELAGTLGQWFYFTKN